MTNIVLCGANGKMGRMIASCINEREDCKVIAGVDVNTKQYDEFPIVDSFSKLTEKPDVIIDFSNHLGTAELTEYAVKRKIM